MIVESTVLNPPAVDLDLKLLQAFEDELDPAEPEQGKIPCKVLGYGEISTVFMINIPPLDQFACKRIAIFDDPVELMPYIRSYREYHRLLGEEIGILLPPNGYAALVRTGGRPVFYSIQQKFDTRTMGQNALRHLPEDEALLLAERVMQETKRVWDYNITQETIEVGIDGQISNWAVVTDDPARLAVDEHTPLVYIDTSTALFRVDGVEQLQAELFLRRAPKLIAPILRRFFLDDVVSRYYEPRQVAIDLIANIYKEQMPALIPSMIAIANRFMTDMDLALITAQEVANYYREDKLIWQLYAASRRLDQRLYRLSGRDYPYILPGEVSR